LLWHRRSSCSSDIPRSRAPSVTLGSKSMMPWRSLSKSSSERQRGLAGVS